MTPEQIAEIESLALAAVSFDFPVLSRDQGKMLLDLIATAKEVERLKVKAKHWEDTCHDQHKETIKPLMKEVERLKAYISSQNDAADGLLIQLSRMKAERDELVRVLGVVTPFIDGKHSHKLAKETLAKLQK
jgi:hypothetical protein